MFGRVEGQESLGLTRLSLPESNPDILVMKPAKKWPR